MVESQQGSRSRVLIITSHPDLKTSFNGQLLETARSVLSKDKFDLRVVDLHAIKFNPVGGRHDFVKEFDKEKFDYQTEQKNANINDTFAPDLKEQIENAEWADYIIHLCPLYWWSLPAIHKGWFDRILVYGRTYGSKNSLEGKKQMFVVTSGGPYPKEGGWLGKTIEDLLFAYNNTTPMYCKYKSLPIFTAEMINTNSTNQEFKNKLLEQFKAHLNQHIVQQKNVLIIASHPDLKTSFNGKLLNATKEVIEKAGKFQIKVVDLVGIKFDPVGGRDDFTEELNKEKFDYQQEQKHASEKNKFAPDLLVQIQNSEWADYIIHVCPLYWWSIPAIHKGWFDRILTYGRTYGQGKYSLAGKKQMFIVSSGGPYPKEGGWLGKTIEDLLLPFNHTTPNFLKQQSLPIFTAEMINPNAQNQDFKNKLIEELKAHVSKHVV